MLKETNMDIYIEKIKNNQIIGKTTDLKVNSVTFDNLIFLDEIIKSYKSIDNIYNQFDLDCNRTNIEINNNKITNIKQFEENIGCTQHIKFSNDSLNNLYEYLVMITLQSSYAFPYIFLHKLYCENKGYIMASNLSTNRNIHINTFTEYLQILIECDLEIKNYKENITLKKINVTLYLKSKYTMKQFNEIDTITSIADIMDQYGLLVLGKCF